jgi:hypothetical protein
MTEPVVTEEAGVQAYVTTETGYLTLEQIRFPAAILLLGGSIPVIVGLAIKNRLPPTERYLLWF